VFVVVVVVVVVVVLMVVVVVKNTDKQTRKDFHIPVYIFQQIF
jgi:hypothetical protein